MKLDRRTYEEAAVLLVGLLGLGAASFLACSRGPVGAVAQSAVSPASGGQRAAQCASNGATAEHTAAVVGAVNTLLAALTPAQRTALRYERTLANAQQWSNFPAGVIARNGVKVGDMSPEAQGAVEALARVAAGDSGAALWSEVRTADELNVATSRDPQLFGRANYYVSVHGAPSTSAPWMLQLSGHHLDYNFTYNGPCTSATPLFDAVQPSTWTDAAGSHAPLEPQRAAMAALLATASALPAARLEGAFRDVLNGPSPMQRGARGGNDSRYPAELHYPTGTQGRGVRVGALTPEQRALVRRAIEAWVHNVAAPVSSALLAVYESDAALDETWVAYAGSADLSASSSYARIDGPRVWIEFAVQDGTADTAQGHYHTLWRDKAADYGAEFASR